MYLFPVLGTFQISLFLISDLIPLWLKNILCMTFFFFNDTCVLAWNTVYFGKLSMCSWQKCVVYRCMVSCSINIIKTNCLIVQALVLSLIFLFCFLSCFVLSSLLLLSFVRGINPKYYCEFVYSPCSSDFVQWILKHCC